MEAHTGPHLEDEDKATLANMAMSHSTSVIPSTVFHDRTRSLSANLGHCSEKRKGSHWETEYISYIHTFYYNLYTLRLSFL